MINRDTIITEALRKCGRIGDGRVATANQIAACTQALASVVNHLATKGMPIWKNNVYEYSFSLLATGSANMGPAASLVTSEIPLKVTGAWRKDNLTNTQISLYIQTKDEQLDTPILTVTSAPINCYFRPIKTFGEVKVWPLPDTYWQTNGELVLNVTEAFTQAATSTDLPDFPNHWELYLTYMLAHTIAPQNGVPINERQLIEKAMVALETDVLGFSNEEGSVFFQPARDYR